MGVVMGYRPVGQAEPHYLRRSVYKAPLDNGLHSRTLSNILGGSANPAKSSLNLSIVEVAFAQFITHDLSYQQSNDTRFDIPVLEGDQFYVPNSTNNFIVFKGTKGDYLPSENEDAETEELEFHVRSFSTDALDMSPIYGSELAVLNKLRSFVGGRLLTSDYDGLIPAGPRFINVTRYYNLPPSQALTGLPVATALTENSQDRRFTAGDDRINENIGLVLINIIWYRNHNYHADRLALLHPTWDDETLFQEARKWNIAEYQHVVLYEYVPSVLGSLAGNMKPYLGFDIDADSRTSLEFTLLAFRYGHSTVAPWLIRRADGTVWPFVVPGQVPGPAMAFAGQLGGPLLPATVFALSDNYTARPPLVDGIRNIMRGLAASKADDADVIYNNDIRNVKFPGVTGAVVDLFSIDVDRAKKSDAPSYYDLRTKHYNVRGLPKGSNHIYKDSSCNADKLSASPDPIECFSVITSNLTLANALRDQYGKVNRIDALVGGLAEDKYPGSLFSRTFAGVILDEYENKRDSDPYWFELTLTHDELLQVYATKFSTLAHRNLDMSGLQDNIFVATD